LKTQEEEEGHYCHQYNNQILILNYIYKSIRGGNERIPSKEREPIPLHWPPIKGINKLFSSRRNLALVLQIFLFSLFYRTQGRAKLG
jgi:hypothetical protein